MKRPVFISLLVLIVALIFTACNQTPPPTATAPIAIYPTATIASSEPQRVQVTVGPIRDTVSYGCGATGISLGNTSVATVNCDPDTNIATFLLSSGDTVSVGLYTTPQFPLPGESVNVAYTAKATVGQVSQTHKCNLADESGNPVGMSFQGKEVVLDLACDFFDPSGTKTLSVSLGYGVHLLSEQCRPLEVRNVLEPTNLELGAPGAYVAVLAFPNASGTSKDWVIPQNFSRFTLEPDTKIDFIDAVGIIYSFSPSCSDTDQTFWINEHLHDVPPIGRVSWESQGVAITTKK